MLVCITAAALPNWLHDLTGLRTEFSNLIVALAVMIAFLFSAGNQIGFMKRLVVVLLTVAYILVNVYALPAVLSGIITEVGIKLFQGLSNLMFLVVMCFSLPRILASKAN
jgi:hypothetical protein